MVLSYTNKKRAAVAEVQDEIDKPAMVITKRFVYELAGIKPAETARGVVHRRLFL
ncbi:MAG: hypothetical protein LBP19_05525 [Treponema sp.]|nr:hypothetical protein [Treponema sp.]